MPLSAMKISFSVLFISLLTAGQSGADTALELAIRADDAAAVQVLLEQNADTDTQSNRFTPLAVAAIRGNAEIVLLLLQAGADPNAASLSGANALSTAIRSCKADIGIVRLLVGAGADIENRSGVGLSPAMLAIQEQRTDIALLLLESGADVNSLNQFGEGLLNYAIYMKNPTLIQAVLDHGVETSQLRKLFSTVDYDPPGMLDNPSHLNVVCH